ncbi:MAG: DNA mismatch repair endonuclease MutL [bacterium]|nr:DNA mismatch repair endonuclease MutL [bacterium]MDY4099052.1 DNA mismatch repair endonuclease MutL [Lachnospiraceae bacterium]
MPDIQLLDEATIEKIAAGEVVERPSSVVKELVENAIDAKATYITVEIKEGGTTFLRITDNGCGIDKEQVRLAFLRHSTSKIRSMEDLLCVRSLGFRGEALASISAVSQVELITRPRGALTGVRYVIEGSKEKSFEEIGAPEGTTFLVRNLFFNTPVRRKFLKSAQTEGGYVATIMERLALSHPEISFQLIVNNQPKLHTSGNCNRKDIIYHIYGKEIAANLLPIDKEKDGIHVSGFIGKPLISRGNRNFENYYINGRYMKSNVVAKAIEEAYKPYLMNRQYPFTVLYITMDEELLDVNVHPTKMEVRFSNGELLYAHLLEMLRDTLQGRDLIPDVTAGVDEPVQKKAVKPLSKELPPQPFEHRRLSDQRNAQPPSQVPSQPKEPLPAEKKTAFKEQVRRAVREDSPYELKYAPRPIQKAMPEQPEREQPQNEQPKPEQPKPEQPQSRQLEMTDVFREENGYQTNFIEEAKKSNIRIIGQLFDTYWLTEVDDKLYIIDQHAAHEKVLFERNMKTFATRDYTSQQVSPPIILSLSMQEQNALNENIEELKNIGFEINEFGGREYAIVAVPDNLYHLDAKQLFLELLDDMVTETGSGRATTEMIWNKVATASCKAAIKGNQRISRGEIEELIKELLTLDNPYHCPHGRPTMISMSRYEIEKKFKRIV